MGTQKNFFSSHWVRVPLNLVSLTLFGFISWKLYYDGLVDDVIRLFLYVTIIVPAVYAILLRVGVIDDPEKFESPIFVYMSNVLMMLIVGAFVLSLFVGLISIAAVFVQTVIDMPWADMGNLGRTLCGVVCIMGLAIQRNWLLALGEDPEDILTSSLGAKAVIGCLIIGLHVLDVLDYTITVGSFIGTLFALFFLPLLLTIGIMRGITFFLDPKVQVACDTLGLTRFLWSDDPSLLEYLVDIAGLCWITIRTVFVNHEALEFVLGYAGAQSWLDTSWYGTINFSSAVVSSIALLGCAAP